MKLDIPSGCFDRLTSHWQNEWWVNNADLSTDHFLSSFKSQSFHAATLSKAGVPHKVKRKAPYRRGYVTIPEGKLPFCCGYSVSWQGEGEDGPWN